MTEDQVLMLTIAAVAIVSTVWLGIHGLMYKLIRSFTGVDSDFPAPWPIRLGILILSGILTFVVIGLPIMSFFRS
jgi:hypothetical protein